jgi:hypothetical protein
MEGIGYRLTDDGGQQLPGNASTKARIIGI